VRTLPRTRQSLTWAKPCSTVAPDGHQRRVGQLQLLASRQRPVPGGLVIAGVTPRNRTGGIAAVTQRYFAPPVKIVNSSPSPKTPSGLPAHKNGKPHLPARAGQPAVAAATSATAAPHSSTTSGHASRPRPVPRAPIVARVFAITGTGQILGIT
jgi:hypothetical protein